MKDKEDASVHNPTAKLADFLKITKFAADAGRSFYDLRSGLSHGQGLGTGSLSPTEYDLYRLGEDVLRGILLRAITYPGLAATFK